MPPRTRSTTTTAPAGRRPKVAGLRAPGRRGVTGESGPAAVGPTDVDPDDVRVDGTDDVDRTAAPAAPTGSTVADPDDAGSTTATGTAATGEAATADPSEAPAAGDRDGGAARPTPKARRTGRSTTPAAEEAGPTPRRGGTALLERPAPARTAASADPARDSRDSRVGRIAAAVTRPFAALGANPRRLITVLVVVLVLSLGLGTWAFVAARSDRADGAPYANAAVVDVGGTAEVVGQTRQAMEQILSYDFTKLDDSVNAAKSQATGSFASEYLSVFEQTIRKPATDQKLRQTATVLNIGVQQLSSDRATLMALVQFTAERTTNGQTTNAPGLLSVQVVKEDGRWKISELKPV
ncbi:hypothetical protein GCM10023201_49860 [Actinomycetospora corticicola]|uniref:Mce-associated membrane protein n=1 Tax=Actinomycetospora corticicola TaxID=663602 RepID=A0A7Y9DYJ2_9PSEU|nr:nuclear transport factor 2 family protein [Actinomycetospora corticicola]NYD37745.1 Mce-associated membrane protein [Actinomycetospora corticicola]